MVAVENSQHTFDEHGFDLGRVHQHQLELESHRVHQLSGHCPIWRNATSEYTDHLEHLFDQRLRFDLLPQVDDMLLRQLPD